jgi:hypothetical protein
MKRSTLAILLSTTSARGTKLDSRQASLRWTECEIDVLTPFITPESAPVQCANLSVPLDYTETLSAEQFDLQLVRVRATQETSKGSVLINPGGPGLNGLTAPVESQALFNRLVDARNDEGFATANFEPAFLTVIMT